MDQHNVADKKNAFSITCEIIIIICIISLAGIIRIPSITQPLGPDQGIMSVIGSGILEGKVPYRDFWEMGSPAIFFTYALMFKLFGLNMAAIPITDILISMITTWLIFLVGKGIWGKRTGYISALLFSFFSSGVRIGMHAGGDIAFGTFWYICQRETFMLPLIAAGFYFVIKAEKSSNNFVLLLVTGFMAGLTFVYKFPSIFIFLCFLLYINGNHFSSKTPISSQSLLRQNIAMVSGFALALIPFILFFSIHGVMQDMIDIIFKYVYSVYGQTKYDMLTTLSLGVRRTFFLAKENFILWVFFIAASLYIVFNDRKKENLLVILWSIAALLFVISHREFFGYHYLFIFPPFSLLAGYGFIKIFENFTFRRLVTADIGKIVVVFALLANVFIFTTLIHMHYTKFLFYLTGKITKNEYYSYFSAYPEHIYSFPAVYEVSQYIKGNTKKEDKIYVLGGIESAIYFLTKRESPSRFIFSWIIFSKSHGHVKQAELYRNELLQDLKNKLPKYIVVVQSLDNFKGFPSIYNFIEENYVLEKRFTDDRFVYRYTG